PSDIPAESPSAAPDETPAQQVTHAPSLSRELLARTGPAGMEDSLDLSGLFLDEDGDELTYSAGSSDSVVANVYVSGSRLTVRPFAPGAVTVTVYAADNRGGSAATSFGYTVSEDVYKDSLGSLIASAHVLLTNAAIGAQAGQFPEAAVVELTRAMEAARETYRDSEATQRQVNEAVDALTFAIRVFEDAEIAAVDLTALSAKMAEGWTACETAVPGILVGQYAEGSIAALSAAVTAASGVHDNRNATQEEVDGALAALTQALAAFQSSAIAPMDFTMSPEPTLYINSTSGTDVLITDGRSMPPLSYSYNKRNLKNLLKIKRGNTEQTIEYKPASNAFAVVNYDTPQIPATLAELTLESTDPQQLTLSPGTSGPGVNMHPSTSLQDGDVVDIELHLRETGLSESQDRLLHVVVDNTSPVFTDRSYSNGRFTLVPSEPLVTTMLFNNLQAAVEGSALGDFTDTASLQMNTDYTVAISPDGRLLTIDLTDMGKSKVAVTAGSKFRITMGALTDYANNPLNEQVIVGVDSY
ncbi:hypothetical protein ACKTOS_23950, partial [Paenibacillus sp. KR2-11]